MGSIWKVLTRKKVIDPVTSEETQLNRVLNTFDLTALGVGSTLGVGVYVLAGHVAKDTAGPSVVLSFLIAAIASVFAGLCYAEFGARAPRAGSAYIYSYVCVGEFLAFVIGWNLILEYVIGSASVARGLSLYLDTLLNDTLKDTFIDIAPIHVSFMSQYFDFFAFTVSFVLSVALAFGMKESSWANNIFTILNICIVLFVIIAGSIKADTTNWHIKANSTDPHIGNGGFFPFGVEGMIKGAATCFYGFVGFDCIATTGEEVKNPKKAIPLSIILSLTIIFLAYFGTSVVVTLMVPYYLQDKNAPIPHAFELVGWDVAKWVVAIGGIFGLCASLFGAMFPLPRIIYAMASDGLVFKFLGRVHSRFQTPVIGTLFAGTLTGLMGAMFELEQLVNMMSIGTLLAYTLVAASVLLLRYTEKPNTNINGDEDNDNNHLIEREQFTVWNVFKQIFNCSRQKHPNNISQRIVSIEVFIYCIFCLFVGLCAMYLKDPLSNGEIWAIVITSIVVFFTVLIILSIATQPLSTRELTFKVPFVPIIPALSILVNIYLMLMLDSRTWIRFAVWMAVGLPIYYFSVIRKAYALNKNVASVSIIQSKPIQNGKTPSGIDNPAFSKSTETLSKEKDDDLIEKSIISTINQIDEILEKEDMQNCSLDSIETYNSSRRNSSLQINNNHNNIYDNNIVINNSSSRRSSVKSVSALSVARSEDSIVQVHCETVTDVIVHTNNNNSNKSSKKKKKPPPAPPIDQSEQSENSKSTENDFDTIKSVNDSETIDSSTVIEKLDEILEKEEEKLNKSESRRPSQKDEIHFKDVDVSIFPSAPPLPPPLPIEESKSNKENPEKEQSSYTNSHPNPNTLSLTRKDLKSVTLRPIEINLQSSSSSDDDLVPPENDNLDFHSETFKKFREKLNNNLKINRAPLSFHAPPIIPPKPSISEQQRQSIRENIIEDHIDKEKIKENLSGYVHNHLNVINSGEPISHHELIHNDVQKQDDETDNLIKPRHSHNGGSDKREHEMKMQNVFDGIKLRKKDSFQNTL